jgi:hypothetical protein
MKNRIRGRAENHAEQPPRPVEPQPIGAILAELLNQYQRQYPDAKIAIVETSASAV